MREEKGTEKVSVGKEWIWDEEMGVRVRRLLGREVLRRVGWCERLGEGLVGKVEDGVEEGAVVVRIGGEGEEREGDGVYDLRGIMDEEALNELRGMFSGADRFFLRKHPKANYTHLALEALKNYTQEDGT